MSQDTDKYKKGAGIILGIFCFLGLSFFWYMVLQIYILDIGWRGFKGELARDFFIIIAISALISGLLGYSRASNKRKLRITTIVLAALLPVGYTASCVTIVLLNQP
jgi:hypothetical protein